VPSSAATNREIARVSSSIPGPLTTPRASRHALGWIIAPPCRGLGTGLRAGPFPNRTARLLPGLLAATLDWTSTGGAMTSLGTRGSARASRHTGVTPGLLGAQTIKARLRGR